MLAIHIFTSAILCSGLLARKSETALASNVMDTSKADALDCIPDQVVVIQPPAAAKVFLLQPHKQDFHSSPWQYKITNTIFFRMPPEITSTECCEEISNLFLPSMLWKATRKFHDRLGKSITGASSGNTRKDSKRERIGLNALILVIQLRSLKSVNGCEWHGPTCKTGCAGTEAHLWVDLVTSPVFCPL